MARAPRTDVVGIPQHVVQRGHNRQPIFFGTYDYLRYCASLATAAGRYGCEIHAYVLMTNHVHLLATQLQQGATARMMQVTSSSHARYINRLRERSGAVWEGRYRSSLVDIDRYFFACQRYIELNPVRAAMVADPADYRWSSYQHYALGKSDVVVTEHALYAGLAFEAIARRRAYRAMFERELDDQSLAEIRCALKQNRALGFSAPTS